MVLKCESKVWGMNQPGRNETDHECEFSTPRGQTAKVRQRRKHRPFLPNEILYIIIRMALQIDPSSGYILRQINQFLLQQPGRFLFLFIYPQRYVRILEFILLVSKADKTS